MDFSADTLRKRFMELTKRYDAIDAKRTALQLERDHEGDSLTEGARRKFAAQIRKLHLEAAPVEEERAMISRALGGKTA